MPTKHVFSTFQKPEYTEENRCALCTVLNVVIATVVSGLVGFVSIPIAVVTFAVFLGVIYVRGYLVPGTPTLTKTYFPDRVLRWFEKEPLPEYDVSVDETAGELDTEAVLLSVDALAESRHTDSDDLRLTTEFQEEWHREMDRLDESVAMRLFADEAGVSVNELSTVETKQWYIVSIDKYRIRDRVLPNYRLGQWESGTAFVADVATARVLERRIRTWTGLAEWQRRDLQQRLRVFLERCPECEGPVSLTEETVETCCRSRRVMVNTCQDCGVRLFEVKTDRVADSAG